MKDFFGWHFKKKVINEKTTRPIVKTGSVWVCNFGLNIGYEIDGKEPDFVRPALVLLGFDNGGGIVLPLTTSKKKSRFLVSIDLNSRANLTQVRYLDSKRFKRPLHIVDKSVLRRIIDDFCELLKTKTAHF
jgi:mRNA-degrading endonuclease toxin of MazEF toxin-antitoxin module